jgi:hypothetical protein
MQIKGKITLYFDFECDDYDPRDKAEEFYRDNSNYLIEYSEAELVEFEEIADEKG